MIEIKDGFFKKMLSVYRPIVRGYLDISKVPAIASTNMLAG